MTGEELKKSLKKSGKRVEDIAVQIGMVRQSLSKYFKYAEVPEAILKEIKNVVPNISVGDIINKTTQSGNNNQSNDGDNNEQTNINYPQQNKQPTFKESGLDKTTKTIELDHLPDTINFKPVPFFNINVSAGDVTFLDGGLLQGVEPDDFMYIPKNVDADIAFPTFGHSMYPEIANGDRVAYKLLKDWSFFNYGMKYLIVTDEQRLLKYIKKHDKPGHLLLESRNKEYQPIDMPVASIRHILQVRYIGKIEM